MNIMILILFIGFILGGAAGYVYCSIKISKIMKSIYEHLLKESSLNSNKTFMMGVNFVSDILRNQL